MHQKIILNLNPKDANLIKEITTNPLHDDNIELKEKFRASPRRFHYSKFESKSWKMLNF